MKRPDLFIESILAALFSVVLTLGFAEIAVGLAFAIYYVFRNYTIPYHQRRTP